MNNIFTGFIIVAACVMTFEARDSAAKVVPARFKVSSSGRGNSLKPRTGSSSRRTTGKEGFYNFPLTNLFVHSS